MSDPRVPARRAPATALPDARDRVVERLGKLFADDVITQAELEARLERVYHAASPADVEAILADLPATGADVGAPASAGEERISALMSAVERQWSGVVPRRLEVRGRLGYVELDLSGATFEPGVTVIDVRALMGYVQVRLPAGVRVESRGRAFAGFFALKGGSRSPDTPCVVQITGRASLGFVEAWIAGGEEPERLAGRLKNPAA